MGGTLMPIEQRWFSWGDTDWIVGELPGMTEPCTVARSDVRELCRRLESGESITPPLVKPIRYDDAGNEL